MIKLYTGVQCEDLSAEGWGWEAILKNGFPADWGNPIYEVDKNPVLKGVEFLRRPSDVYEPGTFDYVLAVRVPLTEKQLARYKRRSDYSDLKDWDPSKAFDYWLIPVKYLNKYATIELWWERGRRPRKRLLRKPPRSSSSRTHSSSSPIRLGKRRKNR